MQKDVIYIDVEDDITAIIGKVKNSKEKVVALVPPKRIGLLQSAVNLRLLARTADLSHKHLVLITSNQALLALASSAKIPVAKNLQSKPEIAEIPALEIDDGEDVIDGEQLPVGELARTTSAGRAAAASSIISGINIDDDTPKATPPAAGDKPTKPRSKSGIKVPSFSDFRKKLFIFGGLGILLIGFLIWAIWFAPRATVVVSARTTPVQVRTQAALGVTLKTDADAATIKSVVQQEKKTDTIEFDATGTEDVGERASGTMTITRSNISSSDTPIQYGTAFSSGSFTFTTTSAVTVPKSSIINNGIDYGSATVNVVATQIGADYNLPARSYQSGAEGFTASGSQMSGGSKKTIKIVTAADIQKATQQLKEQNGDEIKSQLKSKFGNAVAVIDDSFASDNAEPKSEPAIGKEAASGKAKLTSDVTYTMTGIVKSELSNFLRSALEKEISSGSEQRVYDDGVSSTKLANFKKTGESSSINIDTTGQVGPKIDDNDIKEQVKGKRYGEVQSQLKEIEGVSDADTKFWPFWVRTVPNDVKKIKIEFKLQDASKS